MHLLKDWTCVGNTNQTSSLLKKVGLWYIIMLKILRKPHGSNIRIRIVPFTGGTWSAAMQVPENIQLSFSEPPLQQCAVPTSGNETF